MDLKKPQPFDLYGGLTRFRSPGVYVPEFDVNLIALRQFYQDWLNFYLQYNVVTLNHANVSNNLPLIDSVSEMHEFSKQIGYDETE